MSRTRLPAFDAVIFDMDGLLIDTEPTYAHAWKRAALALGVELDKDFLHSLFGHHAADVAQRLETELGAAFDLESFFAEAERFWYEHIEQYGIPLMPGAETILDMLKQAEKPYALATNSDSPFAGVCLERA
ncbi:MAG: HAD-superfamily hydrolase, subfamily variant 3 family protein, partial [Proteobacteria bacterium]|nr:HAD-superfamily hydrolase, subfamily variant 3 family protein [Pseudomonadota bacterium]